MTIGEVEERLIDLEGECEKLKFAINSYDESRIQEILLDEAVVLAKKGVKIIFGIFIVLLSSVGILHIINLIKAIG